MTDKPAGSFSQGVGEWIGGAEVYDAQGQFAGTGRDTRKVQADDGAGTVTVDVTFEGPFTLSGQYTIVDRTTHRLYTGPLNIGYAEAAGAGLVCAHNYWHDLGLNQRFFLMVLPDGSRQLSLAIMSRGEQRQWTVVGEYKRRQSDDDAPPPAGPTDGPALLHRAGRWSGQLQMTGPDLAATGTTEYREETNKTSAGLEVHVAGMGFVDDASHEVFIDTHSGWTPAGPVVGSYSLSGGRGLSGTSYYPAAGLRCWRREVASHDGTMKALVHQWYRGEERIGMTYGTLDFEAGNG